MQGKTSPLIFQNITAIPSIHQRISFSQLARDEINSEKYDCICVELPDFCKSQVIEAVSNFPIISTVTIEGDEEDDVSFIPIEPSDSIIAAVWCASKQEIPLYFIDKNLPHLKPDASPLMPDDYVVSLMGLELFYKTCISTKKTTESKEHNDREKQMAYKLIKLQAQYKKILFIVGLSHWEPIKEILKSTPNPATLTIPAYIPKYIDIYQVSQFSIKYLAQEIPYIISYYYKSIIENKPFDKLMALKQLIEDSLLSYNRPIKPANIKNMISYMFNLNREEKRILPDLLNIVTAAKQCIGEDFGRILYKNAAKYYYYKRLPEYFPIDFTASFYHFEYKGLAPHKRFPLKHSQRRESPLYYQQTKMTGEPLHIYDILQFMIKKIYSSKKSENKNHVKSLYHKPQKTVKQIENFDSNIIIIFEYNNNNRFPIQNYIFEEEYNLHFYAESPMIDMAYGDIPRALFGGYALINNKENENTVINRYPEFIKSEQDKFLFTSLKFSPPKKITYYIAPCYPTPEITRLANHLGKKVQFIPLSNFSQNEIFKLRKIQNLNEYDLEALQSL